MSIHTWSLPLSPLPDRCQLPSVTSMAAVEEPQLSRMPTACLVKPVAARRDFLGLTWDSPIRGLRLQPAATGGLGGAPSGTRLGTTTPVEHSNSKRIRSLDGSRPRIESPVTSSKGRPGHPQRLLSLKEAAAMLGLSPASIRRLISARRLPTVRILRRIQLDSRDLERLIDQSKER